MVDMIYDVCYAETKNKEAVIMDEFMSVPKIAIRTGMVENMVRRYIARFPEFFTYRVSEGVKRYPPEAVEVINRISDLYQEGKGERKSAKP